MRQVERSPDDGLRHSVSDRIADQGVALFAELEQLGHDFGLAGDVVTSLLTQAPLGGGFSG